MNDDTRDLDGLVTERLRRYRPAGPPARLSGRLAPTVDMRWGWAAAAVLALAAVGFSVAASRVEQQTAALLGEPAPAELAANPLFELLEGDAP